MFNYFKNEPCKFYLRDDYNKCTCDNAYHNLFKMGISNTLTEEYDIDGYIQLNIDRFHSRLNKRTDNVCLCCNNELYEKNQYICF